MELKDIKLAVIGLGYVGLPLAVEFGKHRNVVGFDIVELCPNKNDKSSDFLAAKLYYKMLSYKFSNNNEFMDENFEDDDDFKKSKNNLEDYDE